MSYDHNAYTTVLPLSLIEAGGAAATLYGKYATFTAMIAKSAQFTVTVIGTATAHAFSLVKVTGITTSTIATVTIGTSSVGFTTNLLLGTSTLSTLAQGDIVTVLSGADATGKAASSLEMLVVPGANVTA